MICFQPLSPFALVDVVQMVLSKLLSMSAIFVLSVAKAFVLLGLTLPPSCFCKERTQYIARIYALIPAIRLLDICCFQSPCTLRHAEPRVREQMNCAEQKSVTTAESVVEALSQAGS